MQMSDPCSRLFEDPASRAMREPNWMALLGSVAAPWQPRRTAASLKSRFSPIPRGRLRSACKTRTDIIVVFAPRDKVPLRC